MTGWIRKLLRPHPHTQAHTTADEDLADSPGGLQAPDNIEDFGGPGRTRTYNQQIMRPVSDVDSKVDQQLSKVKRNQIQSNAQTIRKRHKDDPA